MERGRRDFLKITGSAAISAGAILAGCRREPDKEEVEKKGEMPKGPIKIAAVSFLSGVAAAPFGIPGNNTFKMLVDKINNEGGILGRKIEFLSKDEAGGVDAQVKLARKLILDDEVDAILGYISSADCKAVLPLSDELGSLIVAYDCGTHELMEGDKSPYDFPMYELGFRSAAHLGLDNIGLALMIKKYFPNIKRIAGINPDYAWGRESWLVFETAMKKLIPNVEVVGTWWPPLFTTDYTAHISALIGAKPEVVHTSLWGGDTVTFTKQALGLGLFEKMKVAYSRGEPIPQELAKNFPEEQIIGCAGPHYFLYPSHDKWPLNKWFVEEYHKRYGKYPTYPCYHAYQAIYSYKAAVERAAALVGGWPTVEGIAKAMVGLSIQTPSGYLTMGGDHNGIEDALLGFTKLTPEYPFPILDPERIEVFPAFLVNPPVGVKTVDWINSWKVQK
ncbi:MAG TPA: ABC transporter substrate-binding protein [Thermodesulfobacteriota bacterium]|nr:ABC transporter substrate-binding protein [Thermodesulfobacteriota bacterium]